MIYAVDGQTAFFYAEDGHVLGCFVGIDEGDSVHLSFAIMSKPGSLLPAMKEAIEHASRRWKRITFYITDDHPYVGTLARLAKRYRAVPVDSDEGGVYYRVELGEDSGKGPEGSEPARGATGSRSERRGDEAESGRGAREAPTEARHKSHCRDVPSGRPRRGPDVAT